MTRWSPLADKLKATVIYKPTSAKSQQLLFSHLISAHFKALLETFRVNQALIYFCCCSQGKLGGKALPGINISINKKVIALFASFLNIGRLISIERATELLQVTCCVDLMFRPVLYLVHSSKFQGKSSLVQ
ncbi:hypothetical protein CEXT_197271 [Caerostris extrusa]|uniref:Uncharacterized protein n=1 Tax=Caerostris extrusa TaxID=172846 RepID=A0AAV4SAV3_CAEEX|nr:hypothetical protein CEXT_197271 [Caerostris extrusa]